jgi:hypothetical protein
MVWVKPGWLLFEVDCLIDQEMALDLQGSVAMRQCLTRQIMKLCQMKKI